MKTKRTSPLVDASRLVPGYDAHATSGDCWFDEDAAARAVRFFEQYLTHVKGELANKPFLLEPWQVAIVANLFGWKRKDGTRRYREAFVFIPRKNGKTAMVAGLVNYVLFWDGEPGAEIYSAAADRDQARLVFEQAKGMVLQNQKLSSHARVYGNSIVRQEVGSSYKAISAEANTKHGYNSHFIVVDELHAQPDRELVDVLATSTGARRQPMIVHITTAGYDRHSICYEKYDYACKVRDGIINDPYFLPVIYEAHAEDDWTKEATWRKANPNLGVSVSLEYMERECRHAQDSPAYENTFKRLHLNLWCVAPGTMFWLASGARVAAEHLVFGDAVVGFDEETGNLQLGTVTCAAEMPPSPIYKIRTSRGREIRVSGNHPFWVRTGRAEKPSYGWKNAESLQIGDRLAVALGRPRVPVGSLRHSADSCRFVGMMLGDGKLVDGPEITTIDPEIAEFASKFVDSLGDELAVKCDKVHYYVRHKVRGSLKQTKTKTWLKARGLWGMKCRTKRIPDCVWKSGTKGWAACLAGFLDTDGHVSCESIIFVSANEPLLRDFQDLCAYLGIQSKLSGTGERPYRLEVLDSASFAVFKKLARPLVARKLAALEALPSKTDRNNKDRRGFDRVVAVEIEGIEPTIGITVAGLHTHVTNGLITHNTEQDVRWLSMAKWDEGSEPFEPEPGAECFVGLDLATTTDLCAMVAVFPLAKGVYGVLPKFYVPEDKTRERELRDRVPYTQWAREGHLTATPGNVVDYEFIRADLQALAEKYNVRKVAIDRWNATQLAVQLGQDGLAVELFGQGFASMSSPTKMLDALVVSNKIQHGGHPVLRWCASNVAVEQDAAGNIKPSKKKSTERIDGIVALVMGLGVQMQAEPDSGCVYNERGPIAI